MSSGPASDETRELISKLKIECRYGSQDSAIMVFNRDGTPLRIIVRESGCVYIYVPSERKAEEEELKECYVHVPLISVDRLEKVLLPNGIVFDLRSREWVQTTISALKVPSESPEPVDWA